MGPRNDGLSTLDVPLERKVDFLRRPSAYRERPREVRAIETHMSWVFLTDAHAYKLKKPVTYSFLDFGTLEARRYYCAEEIRLNRRLARGVYLAAVPLTVDRKGNLSLEGEGTAVDWLVKMRRLPEEGTLESAIRASRVRRGDIEALAELLARFYADATPAPLAPETYRNRISGIVAANEHVLRDPRYGMASEEVAATASAQRRFVATSGELLEARARAGRIVEGHGDLRPEHVHLGATPAVTDCLEFNRDFRIVDPIDELSYLAMECHLLGAPQVGRWLIAGYGSRTADRPSPALILFYKSVRASLRAKISVWHLDDASGPDPGKWRRKAAAYLRLASDYVDEAFAAPGGVNSSTSSSSTIEPPS